MRWWWSVVLGTEVWCGVVWYRALCVNVLVGLRMVRMVDASYVSTVCVMCDVFAGRGSLSARGVCQVG
jgi:hypothetical protein